MHKTDQKIMVRHREFVAEVRSSTSYSVQRSFSLNPGVQATFPWLAKIASSYQTYSIKGMVWHYVPTSGSAISGTNNALGSVMLQTSYRSNDSPPSTKTELLNEYWSCEAVPSEAFCHPIECAPKENPFQVQYIRGLDVPEGDNILLYDLGTTHLAVSGMQADDVVVGDLWVTYEVELSKPVVASNITGADFWYAALSYSSPSTSDMFGVQTAVTGNLPISINNRTITIPRGFYGEFQLFVFFTAATLTNITMTGNPTLTNCTGSPVFADGAADLNRFEMNGSGGVSTGTLVYGTGVTKANRESVATVVLPSYTATAGPTTSRLIVIGNYE
jgi:hypothetical protein